MNTDGVSGSTPLEPHLLTSLLPSFDSESDDTATVGTASKERRDHPNQEVFIMAASKTIYLSKRKSLKGRIRRPSRPGGGSNEGRRSKGELRNVTGGTGAITGCPDWRVTLIS